MKGIYTDIANYNLWANTQLVEYFLNQPESLLEKEIENSFPSIKLTCLHIWDAEFIWLNRLRGDSSTFFPSRFFEGNATQALKTVLTQSKEFCDFLSNQKISFWGRDNHYRTTNGKAMCQLNWEIIHHVFNHSTYHRGQLVMMARQLDLENIPSTDYIFYLRKDA